MKLDKDTADWCVKAQCIYCARDLPIAAPPEGWNPNEWTHQTKTGQGTGTVRCQAGRLRAALAADE